MQTVSKVRNLITDLEKCHIYVRKDAILMCTVDICSLRWAFLYPDTHSSMCCAMGCRAEMS
jgi:hypothetical protein